MTTAGQAFAEPLDERTPYVPTNTAPRVEDREGGEVNVVQGENRGPDLDLLAARLGGSGGSTAEPRSRPLVGGPMVTQVTPQRARSYVRPRRWVRCWSGASVSRRGSVSNRSAGRTRAASAVGRRRWGAAGARMAPASCTAAAAAVIAAAQGDRRRRAARTAATRAAAGVAELRLHGRGGLHGERPRCWVYSGLRRTRVEREGVGVVEGRGGEGRGGEGNATGYGAWPCSSICTGARGREGGGDRRAMAV